MPVAEATPSPPPIATALQSAVASTVFQCAPAVLATGLQAPAAGVSRLSVTEPVGPTAAS